jgi:hypothetical protein
MIVREGSEIRVERVEWRMWVETGVLLVGSLILAVYFTALPNRPFTYFAAAAVVAFGLLLFVSGMRRRQVCVIEPRRFGFGYLDKDKMWWFDRDCLASVRVRKDLLLQVRFYGHDGRMFATSVFAYFDPKELRQAFESAGIPVR